MQYDQVPPIYPPPIAQKPKSNVWIFIVIGACGCAIIAIPIMAAILFPVFSQAREKARETSCMSNVKQSSLGVLMYVQDYDETFPAAQSWMTDLTPYVKSLNVFHCPSAATFNEGGGGEYGYAFNSALSRLSLAAVSDPRNTGMIYDSSTLTENASDLFTSLPIPPRHVHNMYNVFGLVDGHCKAFTPDDFQQFVKIQP